MFVLSKRNLLLRAPDGTSYCLRKEGLQQVPDWVTGLPAFQRRLAAGQIVAVASTADKDIQAAAENEEPKPRSKRAQG